MRIADRVLSGHADFLTSLAISVVSWKSKDEVRRYCAVRRGVLRVDVTWSPPLLFDYSINCRAFMSRGVSFRCR